MKKQKGMTLAEILISLFILSLLAGMWARSVMGQIALTQKTRAITENLYASARTVEQTIQNYKDTLEGLISPTPLPPPSIYTIFGAYADRRDVAYYDINVPMKDASGNPDPYHSIYAIVPAVNPSPMPVPVIQDLKIDIKVDGAVADGGYAPYLEGGSPVTAVEVDVPAMMASMLNAQYLLQINYQWYISGPSFPMRWKYFINENMNLGKLPQYDRDFKVIASHGNTSRLLVTPDMAGKHVVCVATPASASGKMGRSVVSQPQYIFGPPRLDSLAAHFDASIIDNPATDWQLSGSGGSEVRKWPDISGNGADAAGGNPPLLVEDFPRRDSRLYPVIAQKAVFDGSRYLSPAAFALGSASPFTMFAVVKINSMSNSTIISNGTAWAFAPSAYTPPLEAGKWYILGLCSDGTRTVGKDAAMYSGGSPLGGSPGAVKIGAGSASNSQIELAELIVYNNALSSDRSAWQAITGFLGDKYHID